MNEIIINTSRWLATKTLVTTVSVSLLSCIAFLYNVEAPLSSVVKNAVPNWAPLALKPCSQLILAHPLFHQQQSLEC